MLVKPIESPDQYFGFRIKKSPKIIHGIETVTFFLQTNVMN